MRKEIGTVWILLHAFEASLQKEMSFTQAWPYNIHICKRTQGMKKLYYYPLYYFSSAKEVIIYILATRYGLTTYIFAKRPNSETIDTVIRYTFFPLYRRKKK
jgi:hypothetical protein